MAEKCENCDRAIGKLETPCVYQGRIVCSDCDARLRAPIAAPKGSGRELRCPECGSANVSSYKRGWTVWSGFISANHMVLACLQCGHRWRADGNPEDDGAGCCLGGCLIPIAVLIGFCALSAQAAKAGPGNVWFAVGIVFIVAVGVLVKRYRRKIREKKMISKDTESPRD